MPRSSRPSRLRIFSPSSAAETLRISEILRQETVGGLLLLIGAAFGLFLANSPWADYYFQLRDWQLGPAAWHLQLSLAHWAGDGLLAIFFFLVGLELKQEFVAGDMRDFSKAIVPISAAFGGVLLPALIYLAWNWHSPGTQSGWAIPTATDIAFALAVLGIVGSKLPNALRLFLLTLAVVDDLIAIVIIAFAYTAHLNLLFLGLSLLPLLLYAYLAHRWQPHFLAKPELTWLVLLPIGALTWALVHASGIHATISGVALGLTVPVFSPASRTANGLASQLEHHLRPLSAGFAVPVFAFLSAGVALGGPTSWAEIFTSPVTLGVICGLVLGKPLGILLAIFAVTRLEHAELDDGINWIDLAGIGLISGIGFTVSLLLAELSFPTTATLSNAGKLGVISASVLAALVGGSVLAWRNSRYARAKLPQE